MDSATQRAIVKLTRSELEALGINANCRVEPRGIDWFVIVDVKLKNAHHYEYRLTVQEIWNVSWHRGRQEYAKHLAGAIRDSLKSKGAI